jgi:DNA replication and repair protein RecF
MADLDAYGRAVKERQRALETRGVHASDLGEWEALCVRHGLAVMAHRARAATLLSAHARAAFERIAAPELVLEVSYAASAPNDEAAYASALAAKRPADLRRGSASIGPHRDDLALVIDGRPVRGVASQGQHRAVTLALKSAEIDVIGGARGVRPILLLDDVSSELDRARTAALFSFLREQRGQVFLTTTRPELIDTGDDRSARRDFVIERGNLR